MAISYKKLWKLLIDKDMKKKDLQHAARYQFLHHYKNGEKWKCEYWNASKNMFRIRLWYRWYHWNWKKTKQLSILFQFDISL